MKRPVLPALGAAACALALAGFAAALGQGALWPYPFPETGIVIGRWLEGSGFEVRRLELPKGGTRLEGRRGEQVWILDLRPCSALATCVESVSVIPAALAEPWGEALGSVLASYARDGSKAPSLPRLPIPAAVLARRPSVVCVLSRGPEGPRQSSGFAVDGEGMVLTTAHGLEGADTVTVVWPGGDRVPGRLVRTDPDEDLALVGTGTAPGGGFGPHLEALEARIAVEEGDAVYAVGCTVAGDTAVREGRLVLPVRRMGTALLWEVDLPTPTGSSGSPLFDAEGRLVGVVRGRLKADETRGFAIPAQTVLGFLGRPDAP